MVRARTRQGDRDSQRERDGTSEVGEEGRTVLQSGTGSAASAEDVVWRKAWEEPSEEGVQSSAASRIHHCLRAINARVERMGRWGPTLNACWPVGWNPQVGAMR